VPLRSAADGWPAPDPRRVRPVVVLGSASPARRTLLAAAGIDAAVMPSDVDESALVRAAGARASDAHWLTEHLARAKAAEVAARIRSNGLPGQEPERPVLVIGADSLLDFDGRVLGKAASADEVRDRWASMSGRMGQLVTGHVVVEPASGRSVAATVGTLIRFGSPDADEVEAYIASGEPLAVAGSCTIDGLGGAFIDGIDGDHGNVIGLSMPTLRNLVGALGWRWTDLWRAHVPGRGQAP
jgi:septum formation protein